jgi:hypothetical protein
VSRGIFQNNHLSGHFIFVFKNFNAPPFEEGQSLLMTCPHEISAHALVMHKELGILEARSKGFSLCSHIYRRMIQIFILYF